MLLAGLPSLIDPATYHQNVGRKHLLSYMVGVPVVRILTKTDVLCKYIYEKSKSTSLKHQGRAIIKNIFVTLTS